MFSRKTPGQIESTYLPILYRTNPAGLVHKLVSKEWKWTVLVVMLNVLQTSGCFVIGIQNKKEYRPCFACMVFSNPV